MMNRTEAQDALMSMITSTVPRSVWEELVRGTVWAYREAAMSTRNDGRILPANARFRAAQERHFYMERVLARVAQDTGGVFAPGIVDTNRWVYGLARFGQFGLMQKKVSDHREPPPARFREQISAANHFVRQGDLFFMDGRHKEHGNPVQGVVIHAPESQNFGDDGFGRPAFVRLGVPFGDYSGWVITRDIIDLLANYPVAAPVRKGPQPQWRINKKTGTGENK